MYERKIIKYKAEELIVDFNAQTVVGLCLHLWKHFLRVISNMDKDNPNHVLAIHFCDEHVTHYIRLLGYLATGLVKTVISIKIHKISVVYTRDIVDPPEISVRDYEMLNHSPKDIVIHQILEFLEGISRETAKVLKLQSNISPLDIYLIDCHLDSLLDAISILDKAASKLNPSRLEVGLPSKYSSSYLTVEVQHEPLSAIATVDDDFTHVYRIGKDEPPFQEETGNESTPTLK